MNPFSSLINKQQAKEQFIPVIVETATPQVVASVVTTPDTQKTLSLKINAPGSGAATVATISSSGSSSVSIPSVVSGTVPGSGPIDATQPPASVGAAPFQYSTQPDIMAKDTEEQFKVNLQLLRDQFPHKELIAPVTRRILSDLDNHPEFEQWVAPEDIGLMVKLIKQNCGIAIDIAKGKQRKKTDGKPKVDLSDMQNMFLEM